MVLWINSPGETSEIAEKYEKYLLMVLYHLSRWGVNASNRERQAKTEQGFTETVLTVRRGEENLRG